jgi:uncharacterized protein YbjT (DUF2867 family)
VAIVAAMRSALETARPAKVVCLSTIGAQATQPNLLTQLAIMEQTLAALPMPITFLRPAWFMENATWDVAPARDSGVISSFLQPLDKPVPMVATADVGRVAAELLLQTWRGPRIVELSVRCATRTRSQPPFQDSVSPVRRRSLRDPGRPCSDRREEKPVPRIEMLTASTRAGSNSAARPAPSRGD